MNEIGFRVLVVDDERAIRRYLHAALNAHGYIIYEAVNGQEALSAAAAEHPDLIILDLGLPDIDGVEVTRQMRMDKSRSSSLCEQERDSGCFGHGADDYLTKPFSTGS
jgi:two-component system KDP operon response regulator KdpE